MRITILGNNSALPAFGRHPTAQAVTVYGEVLLIDCGEGTQIQMQRFGIKWKNIRHIFISHLHGDHYFGLPGLINSMSLLGRTAPLHVYAPDGLKNIMDSILNVANTTLGYPLHYHTLTQGNHLLADELNYNVRSFAVEHGIACYGFLITTKTRGRKIVPLRCQQAGVPTEYYEELKAGKDFTSPTGIVVSNDSLTEEGPLPKRYAYCADTLYTESFLPIIDGVDGLYHEATYLHEEAEKAKLRYHSTAAQAAQLANKANAKLLLLGHFSSKYRELDDFQKEATAIFPNTIVTTEGQAYDL